MNFIKTAALILLVALVAAPSLAETAPPTSVPGVHPSRRARAVDVTLLPLDGPISDRRAEVSGMTWKDSSLVVLPQHPEIFGQGEELGFFIIQRADILERLSAVRNGVTPEALHPEPVMCRAGGMMRIIKGFDGLESMGIIGDRVYATVEAKEDTVMAGYLVCGHYVMGPEGASIDMTRLTSIPLGLNIPNVAEESMIIDGDRVITFSEANGRNLTDAPRAKIFSEVADYLGSMPFPHIEYRVTDATALDHEGRFWVLNYFYPREAWKLKPAVDGEVEMFGRPPGTNDGGCIERLLELRLTEDDCIVRTGTPPIYLRTDGGGDCRNWEALVRLGDQGFLLMTDKYPGTLFAFVPNPYGH